MWLRNYYNILTAQILCDDTLTSTTQPTDYDPPIMVHLANDTWRNVYASNVMSSNPFQYVCDYLVPPFTKNSYSSGGAFLVTSDTVTSTPGSTQCIGLALGSGTNAVTYDDYKLQTTITSGLTLVDGKGVLTQPTSYDSDTHHVSSIRSYTINNSSASPITISEFGLYSLGGPSMSAVCLIYREVFTPITLQQGESCIISFTKDAEVYNYTPYN